MTKTSVLFAFFLSFFMNAQTISGKILSKEENHPIPYAKIAIDNQNAGTIADENENFKIDLTSVDKNKTLQIQVVGFEKFTISVGEFLKQNLGNIFLTEKVKDIEEVKINQTKLVKKNWGINTKTKRIQMGHNPSKEIKNQSKEVAMLFKTNKKTKIEKININISRFESDKPVFIRFTIYDKNPGSVV
jgi:hypothetical protein